jgi:hypothetical protein
MKGKMIDAPGMTCPVFFMRALTQGSRNYFVQTLAWIVRLRCGRKAASGVDCLASG